MENPSSPLDTLRQLKEMLDAGALTPTEFEALKQRLVFSPGPAPADGPPPAGALTPAAPAAEASPVPPAVPAPAEPKPTEPARSYSAATEPLRTEAAFADPAPTQAEELPPPGWTEPVHSPTPQALFRPDATPDSPVPNQQVVYTEQDTPASTPETEELPAAPVARGSSLGLVLAIAGVLVFLAVVAYLGFNRPTTDEHLTSTSQTAADSVQAAIETGPQVAPLPATSAAPETVRVAPTNPAPALPSRAEMEAKAAAVRDSAEKVQAPAKADSAGNQ